MHKNIIFSILTICMLSEHVHSQKQSFDIFDPFGKAFDPVDWAMDFGYNKIVPILESHEGKMVNSFW